MDRFDIGTVRVHRIEEWRGNFAPPEHLLAGCTPEAFAPYAERFSPGYYDLDEHKLFAFLQSWVLEVDGLRILFDTGAGTGAAGPPCGRRHHAGGRAGAHARSDGDARVIPRRARAVRG